MITGMPFLLEHNTVEDACMLCSELQLDFVELNANFPPCQTERLDAEALLKLKERYHIGMTLHIEEECDPFAFQRSVRQAWLSSVRTSLELARLAGIDVVNMHLPHGVYITLPNERVFLYQCYREEYEEALAEFRTMCEQTLQGSNVRISIENTNGFMPHEQEAVCFLLQSPVFGLTLDIGHLHGTGYADLPFYEEHVDRLIHMHFHDALGRKDHRALGDGEIDLKRWFSLAQKCNARIVLETKTTEALRQSVRWLRERS